MTFYVLYAVVPITALPPAQLFLTCVYLLLVAVVSLQNGIMILNKLRDADSSLLSHGCFASFESKPNKLQNAGLNFDNANKPRPVFIGFVGNGGKVDAELSAFNPLTCRYFSLL